MFASSFRILVICIMRCIAAVMRCIAAVMCGTSRVTEDGNITLWSECFIVTGMKCEDFSHFDKLAGAKLPVVGPGPATAKSRVVGQGPATAWVGLRLTLDSYEQVKKLCPNRGFKPPKEFHITLDVIDQSKCNAVISYLESTSFRQAFYLRDVFASPDGSVVAVHVEFEDPQLHKFCKSGSSPPHITLHAPRDMAVLSGPMIMEHLVKRASDLYRRRIVVAAVAIIIASTVVLWCRC